MAISNQSFDKMTRVIKRLDSVVGKAIENKNELACELYLMEGQLISILEDLTKEP